MRDICLMFVFSSFSIFPSVTSRPLLRRHRSAFKASIGIGLQDRAPLRLLGAPSGSEFPSMRNGSSSASAQRQPLLRLMQGCRQFGLWTFLIYADFSSDSIFQYFAPAAGSEAQLDPDLYRSCVLLSPFCQHDRPKASTHQVNKVSASRRAS